MTTPEFVHLHLHTEYSLLDGAIRVLGNNGKPSSVFDLAKKYNMPAMAITDHGNMYGVIEFYQTCMKLGIKPIIGCEVYVAPESRLDKSAKAGEETAYHLVLLCKNEQGYKNLMKLVSIGFMEGFYYKPRVDKEVLKQYSDGLIALSACIKGEVPHYVILDKMDKAKEKLLQYLDIFGKDNFYLELQDHNLPEQKKANQGLIALSKEFGLKCVATNDSHYTNKKDAYIQEVLLCVGTGKTLDDPTHMKFSTDEFYFKSPDEMKELFKEIPDAITNTLEIANRCNVELDFSKIYLPVYDVPEGFTLDSYLEHLCRENIENRYGQSTKDVEDRLTHELNIISRMGYSGYFLIVWDFIHHARRIGVPVGPGRGSGAGSIVSYLLKITDVDPLKYNLLFERFLNPDRNTMPDLDIDFSDAGREDVISYVRQKYGEKNVAQIVTFGSMQARLALRDVGRVLNVPLKDVDKLAKLIPTGSSINEALTESKQLKAAVEENESYKRLFEVTREIEGIKRHIGIHAAGIVIAKDDMTNYVPFTKSNKDVVATQYEGNGLVSLGLLKMDFLGLRNLTVIDNAVKLIEKIRGEKVDIENIPLDDEKTYQLLKDAKAIGVFQMESTGMRDLLRKLQPTSLEDLIALIALYRPGPMGSGMLDDFVARKHGRSEIVYEHPLMEPILKETYGVLLYQEQVMRLAVALANFSPAKADNLRKAMGKKIPEIIEKERANFVNGAKENKISEKIATKVFDNIVKFGGYGFNKSHSTAYGLVAYRTAYLKANYPLEYMTALLNSELGNTDKIVLYKAECDAMGMEILPPNVEKSFEVFSVEGNPENKKIRFGLLALKNVGEAAIKSIIAAREKDGEFKSMTDFLKRIDLRTANKKVCESLVKAGAFDSFGHKRASLMSAMEGLVASAAKTAKDEASGQFSLFDGIEDSVELKEDIPNGKEWPEHEFLANEKEIIGFYMSGHPLSQYEKQLSMFAKNSIMSLKEFPDEAEVVVGGVISHCKKIKTKKGSDMAAFKLEDMNAEAEVIVFPKTYESIEQSVLAVDNIVIVRGKIDASGENPKILAEEIFSFFDAKDKLTKRIVLSINTAGLDEEVLKELKNKLSEYPGRCEVLFKMRTPVHGDVFAKTNILVNPCSDLEDKIKALLGDDAVAYEA